VIVAIGCLGHTAAVVAGHLVMGLAAVGLLIFTLTPRTAMAFVGAACWGLGASLGFPVGMSAGADEPRLAAPRVSVITSIGYVAFVGGPPLIGLLASWLGLPHALWVVILPLGPAALIARVAAPLRPRSIDRVAETEPAPTAYSA
jgi:MFS family permease